MNPGDEIGQILTFTECNVIDINDIELINTNDWQVWQYSYMV